MTPDDDWTAQARRVLDADAQALDASTLSRLTRARHAAIDARRASRRRVGWIGGIAAAGAIVLAVALVVPREIASTESPMLSVDADSVELIDVDEPLDLYEDLEFYAWLDAQDGGNG